VTNCDIVEIVGDRRPGDPPKLIADPSLANTVLGWEPQYQSPKAIIETAWAWHQTHPYGYTNRIAK
jgi:UDP-glucose 4-epimerase